MKTYKILRMFANGRKYTIERGLTKAEAKEHCQDPETSSRTAVAPAAVARTKKHGTWFDAFESE